jgi:VWFA-related protein
MRSFEAFLVKMKTTVTVLFLLFLLMISGAALAQSGRSNPKKDGKANQRPVASPTPVEIIENAGEIAQADDRDVIKVNTQLVSLPVRIMDRKGRFVPGLTKDDFKVTEDGAEQEISMFTNEHQPFTVALMLDMSYSTKFKISEIQYAAITFIDQLRPQDKVMVVSFDGDVHVLCDPTNDRKTLYSAIKSTKISMGTSLYEAVDLVINEQMRKIEGRKAIILFTDGVDTTSQRVNERDNLSDAMELDSLIYPIRYDTFQDVQALKNNPLPPLPGQLPGQIPGQLPGNSPIPAVLGSIGRPSDRGTSVEDYQKAHEYLDQLAARTGGREYLADSIENLSDAFSKIASELREFYSIGYYPTAERLPGKTAKVTIRVRRQGLVVRAKETILKRRESKEKPT